MLMNSLFPLFDYAVRIRKLVVVATVKEPSKQSKMGSFAAELVSTNHGIPLVNTASD
jgi:hypothetical protein